MTSDLAANYDRPSEQPTKRTNRELIGKINFQKLWSLIFPFFIAPHTPIGVLVFNTRLFLFGLFILTYSDLLQGFQEKFFFSQEFQVLFIIMNIIINCKNQSFSIAKFATGFLMLCVFIVFHTHEYSYLCMTSNTYNSC